MGQAPQHQPQQAPSWLGPLPTPKPVPGGGLFTHQANPMDAASRPRQPSNPQSQQQTAPVLPPGELPAWTGALLNTKSTSGPPQQPPVQGGSVPQWHQSSPPEPHRNTSGGKKASPSARQPLGPRVQMRVIQFPNFN